MSGLNVLPLEGSSLGCQHRGSSTRSSNRNPTFGHTHPPLTCLSACSWLTVGKARPRQPLWIRTAVFLKGLGAVLEFSWSQLSHETVPGSWLHRQTWVGNFDYYHLVTCMFTATGKCELNLRVSLGFHGGSYGTESACNAGNPGMILGSGRSTADRNGNPLQYSCLENSMDRGA